MNVSSVGNSWYLYNKYGTQNSNSTNTASATDTETQSTNSDKKRSTLDSETLQALFSGMLSQGIVFSGTYYINSSNGTGESANEEADTVQSIASVLEKVKNGTVSDSDLTDLQSLMTRNTENAKDSGDGSLSIEEFLGKVKNGTVTDSDLNALQSELNSLTDGSGIAAAPPPPPPPPPPPSEENDAIKAITDFLEKVKDGTATDSDLSDLQALLTQSGSQTSDTSSVSAADPSSSVASASSASNTSNSISLEEFLEKVKNGSITDSDLSLLQTELNEQQGESGAGLTPPPPPIGKEPVASGAGAASTANAPAISRQLLLLAAQAYDNSGWYSDSGSSYSSTEQTIKV